MPEMREFLNDGRIHLVLGPMCHWCMASTRSKLTGVRAWKNEMGNEQLEAGNIVGERTCWRKSSSSVDWAEWNDFGSDVVTETCADVLKTLGKQLVDDGRLDSVSLYSAGQTTDFPELDTQERERRSIGC